MCQVTPQQVEPTNLDKSIKFMIQSQNDSLDRLEAQMESMEKSMNEQILKLSTSLPFPTNLIGIKNHCVIKILVKIQFHLTNLNLTNPNS